MNVFITGATGFVGRNVCEYFHKNGFSVYGLVRDEKRISKARVEFIKPVFGDLESFDGSFLTSIDYVIHVAGLIRAPSYNEFYKANVLGTKAVVEKVVKYAGNIKRFIYVSSLAAGGPASDGPRREEDPDEPVSHYGKTKLYGEYEIHDLPYTILRPPVIFGPYDSALFIFFSLVEKYRVAPIAGFKPRHVDFIYIEDFCKAVFDVLKTDVTLNKKYYLGGNPLSWEGFGELIENAADVRTLKVRIPISIMWLTALLCEMGGFSLFSREKVKELSRLNWTSSCERASRDFSFSRKFSNEVAVKITYEWYKKNNWL